MSVIPKRQPPDERSRDHEHVGRISTQTTIFVLIAIALVLYEIQWILPPFVIAGLLAYITTPAIAAGCRARFSHWWPSLCFCCLR
jgi:predicted PurR-regulated permease PerM